MKKMNFVSMLMAQAKTGREVAGTIARLVPDNEKFRVRELNAETGTVVLEQVLASSSIDTPRIVTLDEHNGDAASYVRNPNPRLVPDAKVEMRDGKKCLVLDPDTPNEAIVPLGNIEAIEALGGMDGQIFLTVGTRKDGAVTLTGYDVQGDTFYPIADGREFDSNVKLVPIDRRYCYLVENVYDRTPVEDAKYELDPFGTDRDVEPGPIFKAGKLYLLSSWFSADGRKVCGVECDFHSENNGHGGLDSPIRSARIVRQARRSDIVIITDEPDGGYRMHVYPAIDRLPGKLKIGDIAVDNPEAQVFLGGANDKPPVVTVKDEKKVVIWSRDGEFVIDDPDLVRRAQGYNFFCSVYRGQDDRGREMLIWSYANDGLDVIKFTTTETDRGLVAQIVPPTAPTGKSFY